MNMITVLRIISRMNIGGPSIHVALLTRHLDRNRFNTLLVTGALSKDEGDMRYLVQGNRGNVRTLPNLRREIHPLRDVKALLAVFQILWREKPDIVHTHTAKAGTVGRLASVFYRLLSGRKVATVHTFHGNVFEGYFDTLQSRLVMAVEWFLALSTDAVIAISPLQKRGLVHVYGIVPDRKVHMIRLGFALQPFLECNQEARETLRHHWRVSDDTILIGIVGRLVPIKNHRMFLDAAKLFLEKQGTDKVVRFAIIGDGELRQALETHAAGLGIAERVLFCGWQKNMAHVYAALDVVALTSFNEGTPVSIIEAMAAGVPVIATAVGGIDDLLGAGEANGGEEDLKGCQICERGVRCPKSRPDALAVGLGFILRHDVGKGSRRTEKARRFVMQHYSEERLVREVASLYERLSASQ